MTVAAREVPAMTILLELNPSTQPGRPRERSRGAHAPQDAEFAEIWHH
jgi:hypothetical protein